MRSTVAELENQLEKMRRLESRLTFRLSVLSKKLDHQATELLKGTPLTLTAYRMLNVVDTFEAASISDISRYTALDRAQISRTAEALGKQGIVEFADDPRSKRKKLVLLSAKGHEILDGIRPRFQKRQQMLIEELGAETYEELGHAVGRLGDILSA